METKFKAGDKVMVEGYCLGCDTEGRDRSNGMYWPETRGEIISHAFDNVYKVHIHQSGKVWYFRQTNIKTRTV